MDSNEVVPSPPVLSAPVRSISGFWQRFGAFLLDGLILGVFGQLLGLCFFDSFARMGAWGRLIGFLVSGLYFTVFNSRLGEGKTVGKRAAKIEVVDSNGNYISLGRSFLRYLMLGIPFFLNGVQFNTSAHPQLWTYLIGVPVLGALGAIPYLYLFNRRTRQSLDDLVAGTYVTKAPGAGSPSFTPFWRGHLAVVGAWVLACAGLAYAIPSIIKLLPLENLFALQQKIMAAGEVSSTSVMVGKNWRYVNGVSSAEAYFLVTAAMRERPSDYEASATKIAAVILANYPEIMAKDSLSVTVVYGYDIGIARAQISHGYAHKPQEWASFVASAR